MPSSTFFTDGYSAGFEGKPCSPPDQNGKPWDDHAVKAGEYVCGHRIGRQAAKELGSRLGDLARYSRQAASAFNGTRRDSEAMRNDLLMCRSLLERIAHLIVL